MRKILPYILGILSFQMHSQTENKRNALSFKELNNGIRLNYILVEMPTDQVSYDLAPKMSLMGLHYNIPITKGLYAGAGMHAAITGDQGGLFTLGILLGTNQKIYKNHNLQNKKNNYFFSHLQQFHSSLYQSWKYFSKKRIIRLNNPYLTYVNILWCTCEFLENE